jgi:site-specific recombinase XerD
MLEMFLKRRKDMNEELITMSATDQITIYQEPICNDGSTIEDLIASFVKAKFARTQSTKTAKAYAETLQGFRWHLQERELDLVANLKGKSVDDVDRFRVQIAEAARDYAILSAHPGRFVAKSTRNQRLAIISSFYTYAAQNFKISLANPLEMVERSRVESYGNSARPLEQQEVQERLAALAAKEPKTMGDRRDYALLTLLFSTGRRVSEIANLRYKHVHVTRVGKEELVTLTFANMKQGKNLVLPLNARVSAILLDYLRSYYGAALLTLPGDAPIWVYLSEVPMSAKQLARWERLGKPQYLPLEYQAIRNICQKYMDVSRTHTARYTFNRLAKQAGATLEERQDMLMHSSPVTTQIYDKQLERGTNKYTEQIADLLGL